MKQHSGTHTFSRTHLIVWAVLITAFSILAYIPILQSGDFGEGGALLQFAPAIAAIVTALIFKRSLSGLGLKPRSPRLMGWAFVVPILVLTTSYGAVWLFTGSFYDAAFVEAASGQTYEQYVMESIIEPLEMHQTGFSYTPAMMAVEATGAHPNVDLQTLLMPLIGIDTSRAIREKQDGIVWFNHIYSDQNGPTGLIGPATDLARFTMAYLNGGELNGQRILAEETVAMMTNESHIISGNSPDAAQFEESFHGLGWVVVPTEDSFYLTHSGGGQAFQPTCNSTQRGTKREMWLSLCRITNRLK